jgi:hypothetical protein
VLFSFALVYAIRKVHEIQVGMKLNWTYKPLACADNVNLLEDDIIMNNISMALVCEVSANFCE